MKHVVPHDLDPETARRVADRAWASYSERFAKYAPTIRWITPDLAEVGFSAKGIDLTGSIELRPREIAMELEVPFLLRIFKGRAIAIIEAEIRKWIAAAKAGQI
jgi:hypothetical protein